MFTVIYNDVHKMLLMTQIVALKCITKLQTKQLMEMYLIKYIKMLLKSQYLLLHKLVIKCYQL